MEGRQWGKGWALGSLCSGEGGCFCHASFSA